MPRRSGGAVNAGIVSGGVVNGGLNCGGGGRPRRERRRCEHRLARAKGGAARCEMKVVVERRVKLCAVQMKIVVERRVKP